MFMNRRSPIPVALVLSSLGCSSASNVPSDPALTRELFKEVEAAGQNLTGSRSGVVIWKEQRQQLIAFDAALDAVKSKAASKLDKEVLAEFQAASADVHSYLDLIAPVEEKPAPSGPRRTGNTLKSADTHIAKARALMGTGPSPR